jgi:hypothetical protein
MNQKRASRTRPYDRGRGSVTGSRNAKPVEESQRTSLWGRIGKNIGRQWLAIVAVLIALATFINTIRIEQDNASNARSHDASLVTYWLQGNTPYSSKPQVMVTNLSPGLITNVTLYLPIPTQKTSQGGCDVGVKLRAVGDGEGYELLPGCKGMAYYSIRDIPPCTTTETPFEGGFVSPRFTFAELNGSELLFTDPNGNSWARYAGSQQKLIPAPGYKGPWGKPGFDWSGPATSQPAVGCSG